MNKGFTLVELMIVVAIIGILAVVAVPAYGKYIDEAAKAEANTNLVDIAGKQAAFYRTWNTYVTTANDAYTSTHEGKQVQGGNPSTNLFQKDNTNWKNLGFDPGGPTYWTYTTRADGNGFIACAARLIDGINDYAAIRSTNPNTVVFYGAGTNDPCSTSE